MTERKENICHQLGCPAACCRDVLMVVTKDEINSCFPRAKQVRLSEMDELWSSEQYGVYWCWDPLSQGFAIRIVGECPNLTNDLSCGIYSYRPKACADTPVGSSYCNNKRRKIRLDPVDIKLIPPSSIS